MLVWIVSVTPACRRKHTGSKRGRKNQGRSTAQTHADKGARPKSPSGVSYAYPLRKSDPLTGAPGLAMRSARGKRERSGCASAARGRSALRPCLHLEPQPRAQQAAGLRVPDDSKQTMQVHHFPRVPHGRRARALAPTGHGVRARNVFRSRRPKRCAGPRGEATREHGGRLPSDRLRECCGGEQVRVTTFLNSLLPLSAQQASSLLALYQLLGD